VFANCLMCTPARLMGMEPILDCKTKNLHGLSGGDDLFFDGKILYPKAMGALLLASLHLEHAYGYFGDRTLTSNLFYNNTGKIVYPTAAIGVVHDPVTNTQKHFMGHNLPICCLNIHPKKQIMVSAQHGVRPVVLVWDSETVLQLQRITLPLGDSPEKPFALEPPQQVSHVDTERYAGKVSRTKRRGAYGEVDLADQEEGEVNLAHQEEGCLQWSQSRGPRGGVLSGKLTSRTKRRGAYKEVSLTQQEEGYLQGILTLGVNWRGSKGICAVGFSSDGETLVTVAADFPHTLYLWQWTKPDAEGTLKEPHKVDAWFYGPAEKVPTNLGFDTIAEPPVPQAADDGGDWKTGDGKAASIPLSPTTCRARDVPLKLPALMYSMGRQCEPLCSDMYSMGRQCEPLADMSCSLRHVLMGRGQQAQSRPTCTLDGALPDLLISRHAPVRPTLLRLLFSFAAHSPPPLFAVLPSFPLFAENPSLFFCGSVATVLDHFAFRGEEPTSNGHARSVQHLVVIALGWARYSYKAVRVREGGEQGRSVCYSREGSHMAIGGKKGRVRIVSSTTLQPLALFKLVDSTIPVMKYSPNNQYLAVGSHDLCIDVYDTGFRSDDGSVQQYPKMNKRWQKELGGTGEYVRVSRCEGHSASVRFLDWSLPLANPPHLRGMTILQSNCAGAEILYYDPATGKQIKARCHINACFCAVTTSLPLGCTHRPPHG
ncbi:hypothetical protein CYMTET_12365, partial [Cymbomonas tetramitiformis]